MSPFPAPVLDAETGEALTRRTSCPTCSTAFQQTALAVVGETDAGGLVERRTVYVPTSCPSCSRAKIRAAAHQGDTNIGFVQPRPPLTMEPE